MTLAYELKRRARRAAAPVLGVCAIAYFVHHAVEGRYGLVSWHRLATEIGELEQRAAILDARRATLEGKVSLLRPDHLDPDLLDEEVRKALGFVRRDEVIIR